MRLPGQYFDQETGLHYNYFRDYDPSTGRYVESDPIGLDGGMNTYGYAEENPLTFIDPFGLTSVAACANPANAAACAAAGIGARVSPIAIPLPVTTQNSENSGDSNVIPFPGSKSEEKDTPACDNKNDGSDWCQKEKERLESNVSIGKRILDSISNSLQRRRQYLIWAKELNISINIHNASCPNHKVTPLPL